jgi:hypothetical protein
MFAGCTVTSGTVNDTEGGTVTPTPTSDGGTDAAASCPGNTKQTATIVSASCQAALDTSCCAQLTACFDIVPAAGDGGVASEDCNAYTKCLPSCLVKTDGTPETDQAKVDACYADCDLLTGSTPATASTAAVPSAVQTAYEAIVTCGKASAAAKAPCGL